MSRNNAEQWYTGCDRNDPPDPTYRGGAVLDAAIAARKRYHDRLRRERDAK